MSHIQGLFTLHVYNVLIQVVKLLMQDKRFFIKVYHHVVRSEFQ